MRHSVRVCALAVIAFTSLAGCSSTSGAPDATLASEDALLPPAEGITEYPLTVSSEIGDVVIEVRPSRVVMASSWDADLFAALGVQPVAADEQVEFYPWVLDAFPSPIETLLAPTDVAYPAEAIANTKPDLVVDTMATDAEEVRQVSDIAPMLGAPEGIQEELPWQERILALGEALDLSGRAQQVIDEYDASFQSIRSEHPEFNGKSVDYLVFWGGGTGASLLNTAGSDQELLLGNLGFAPNPNADNAALQEEVPAELLDTLSGDVLVISNQAEQSEFDAFYGSPLMQRLASVQAGRSIVLDVDPEAGTVSHEGELEDFTGHFGRAWGIGPLAHAELIELMVPLISESVS